MRVCKHKDERTIVEIKDILKYYFCDSKFFTLEGNYANYCIYRTQCTRVTHTQITLMIN